MKRQTKYQQLTEVLQSLALVLVGSSTYQMSARNTVHEREKSLGSFWSVWKTELKDLWVKAGGYPGHSNHRIIEFLIIGKVRQRLAQRPPRTSTGQTLACLGYLGDRDPCEAVLKGK